MSKRQMSFISIDYKVDGPIAFLVLNRPEKLNAINADMVRELNLALDAAEADDDVQVIVLSGNGRAFSAGFDLDPDGDAPDAVDLGALRQELQDDFDIIMRFWDSPKITVAAVHGYCLGSAMEMAVACDITLSAEECRFGAPEVRFGSGIVALVLPWFAGPKRAKELLLTGNDRISAQQAEDYGLVNKVVPGDCLLDEARNLGVSIAGNDQLAVRMTKLAINRSYDIAGMRQSLLQALELDIIVEGTETDESKEFNRRLHEEGTGAAIAWRASRVRESSQDD